MKVSGTFGTIGRKVRLRFRGPLCSQNPIDGILFAFILCFAVLLDSGAQQQTASRAAKDAQDAESADQNPYVLKSTVREVLEDVQVVSANGVPVQGLSRADFQVFEDRTQQSIHGFDEHSPKLDRSNLPPADFQLPTDTFMNLERTPSSGPPCVVVLDELNTSIEFQMYAYQQIMQFLRKKEVGTPVAIFLLGDRFEMLEGFTADRDRLGAAMKRQAAKPKLTVRGEDSDFDDPTGADPAIVARRYQAAQMTLDAFIEIGKFLAAVPGRKNLLWFSRSFDTMPLSAESKKPDQSDKSHGSGMSKNAPSGMSKSTPTEMDQSVITEASFGQAYAQSHMAESAANYSLLVERLRKVTAELAVSHTAVYPIDERGLFTDPGDSAAINTCTPGAAQGKCKRIDTASQMNDHHNFVDTVNAEHATMLQIAEATGGKAFFNTNDLALAGLKALDAGSYYYTLSYSPKNAKFDGSFRHIEVRLKSNRGSGMYLTYRRTYVADDPKTLAPISMWNDPMEAALLHGAPEAQSILFKVKVDPEKTDVTGQLSTLPVPADGALKPKEKQRPEDKSQTAPEEMHTYDLRFAVVMGDQLKFTHAADGYYHGSLDLATVGYAADGRKLGGNRQNLDVSMPPQVFRKSIEDGFFHKMSVALPANASTLRIAVRDPASGNMGTIEIPLPIAEASN